MQKQPSQVRGVRATLQVCRVRLQGNDPGAMGRDAALAMTPEDRIAMASQSPGEVPQRPASGSRVDLPVQRPKGLYGALQRSLRGSDFLSLPTWPLRAARQVEGCLCHLRRP